MTTFEQWARDVDSLCVRHLCCTWADLAGDSEPLERSFTSGETPMQFVRWWTEQRDRHSPRGRLSRGGQGAICRPSPGCSTRRRIETMLMSGSKLERLLAR